MKLPAIYLPHGGGPCFFMDWDPPGTWTRMAAWLRELSSTLPAEPKALLVVSGHWEAPVATVTASPAPPLLYDYSGFPPHTYALEWPAKGSPALASEVERLLADAGIVSASDPTRGFDHGVFVPLKVAFPTAALPTVQLSLVAGLDPAAHLAVGRALAPLRHENVLLLGSGMSYHNMGGFFSGNGREHSLAFDTWLGETVGDEPSARDAKLREWAAAPSARQSHPREEHLVPLMVMAGAAGTDRGEVVFRDEVMNAVVSAVRFG